MKTRISHILAAGALALCTIAASAQGFNTGYFLDGYNYRYKLNPALDNEKGFVGVAVGDLGISSRSNVGLSTFIYPNGSKLTTALSPSISSEQFLSQLNDFNNLNLDLDLNLFAVGIRTGNLYHTIDVSVRGGVSTSLPYDLFRFLKDGTQNGSSFDISDIAIDANAYAQIAYGITARIGDKIKVGARLKMLGGIAEVQAQYDNININLDENQWKLSSHGSLKVSANEITHTTMQSEISGNQAIDKIDPKFGMPKKFGLGIDLGVSYEVIDGLTLSAAIIDLGTIGFNSTLYAKTNLTEISYIPDQNMDLNNSESGISDQTNDAVNKIQSITEFVPANASEASKATLGMTINAGAEYRLPMYDKLSIGLLGTYKQYSCCSITEARLSANYSPLEWLSMSLSGAAGTMGGSFGAALNIHPKVVNFFIGTDSYVARITPQFIPVGKANTSVRMGLSFNF